MTQELDIIFNPEWKNIDWVIMIWIFYQLIVSDYTWFTVISLNKIFENRRLNYTKKNTD